MQPADSTPIAAASTPGVPRNYGFAYIGSDQRIYAVLQNTESVTDVNSGGVDWQTVDVLALWQSQTQTGVPLPFPRSDISPRSDGPICMNWNPNTDSFDNDPPDAYLGYIDANSHVQGVSMSFDGSPPVLNWPETNADLTEHTGAPPAARGSGIASYYWQSQQSQHIVYVGTDGNVWELYLLPNTYTSDGLPLWQSNNLSGRTGYLGALAPKANSPLAATMFEREQTEHVIYVASDNTIRELYFYDGSWGGNNLSAAAGASPPSANTPLVTYACTYEDTLHVFYIDEDGHLQELWWQQGSWQMTHNLDEVWGKKPAPDSDLAGYSSEYEQTHHIIYTDVNGDLIEVYRKGDSWGYTLLIGVPNPETPLSTSSPIAGYAVEVSGDTGSEQVFYVDSSRRVHQLYRANNSWNFGLTSG
jgi:Fungal fucose-specific lectin